VPTDGNHREDLTEFKPNIAKADGQETKGLYGRTAPGAWFMAEARPRGTPWTPLALGPWASAGLWSFIALKAYESGPRRFAVRALAPLSA
jgi:hypothetical protein